MTTKIPIEISARHIHLCREDLDKLFGSGYELKIKKDLSQEGEFASEETVTLIGPKNTIEKLRVVGPIREKTQVELSYSDCFFVGIDVPLRLSGDVAGSAGAKIAGPVGEIELKEGVIIAKRHLHLNPKEADELNLKNNDLVKIKVIGERGLVFENIVVRVKPNFKKSAHIDTDEANAAGVTLGAHSLTHPVLPTASEAVRRREIAGARRWLERGAGVPVRYFAYPDGAADARARRLVAAAGYRAAFLADAAACADDPLRLPRKGLYTFSRAGGGFSPAVLAAELAGVFDGPARLVRWR